MLATLPRTTSRADIDHSRELQTTLCCHVGEWMGKNALHVSCWKCTQSIVQGCAASELPRPTQTALKQFSYIQMQVGPRT